MDIDAFRWMRRGMQISTLNKNESFLLESIVKTTDKNQKALLLIHGFSSTPAVFRLLVPALSNCYDAIFCPVLVGHSQDLDSFAKVKAKDWLLQMEETYKTLASQFERVEVLGLSLGGLLGCHLSARFNLPHLYLLAPAFDILLNFNFAIKLAKALNWLGFRKIRAAAGNLYATEHFEIAYRQLPLTSIIEMLTLSQEFKLTEPQCPTDVFLGCFDEVVSSWRVADRFANKTQINVHWLPNSAHVLPLDGDVEKIIECIKQNSLASRAISTN